jgi:hypothetical protein
MVLAARPAAVRPYTDTLPKALVPVDGETTILDIALQPRCGQAHRRDRRGRLGEAVGAAAALEERHGPSPLVQRQGQWNNCYCWLARDHFAREPCWSATPCTRSTSNHSTWPPATSPGPAGILLAWTTEVAGRQEMKVVLDAAGRMTRITKLMDPAEASGDTSGHADRGAGGRRARHGARGDLAP